jgi:hypothetical protein
VLVVAALEAVRSPRTWTVVAFCIAGVAGTMTLPHFAIAFVVTGAALLVQPALRRAWAIGGGLSLLAITAFYAPHLGDLAESSRQDYASPIGLPWIVTAPIDQTLLRALAGIDEVLLDPGVGSLVVTIALAVVLSASPLLRERHTALVLGGGVVVTVVVFWATRTSVAPRFFSFLLVPLCILLASGAAAIVTRFASERRPIVRTLLAVWVIAYAAFGFAEHIERIARLPREAVREAAALIDSSAPASTRVVTYVPYPHDLEHYLGRRVDVALTPTGARRACEGRGPTIYVSQPWILEPATLPCLERAGVQHHSVEQYARGGRIDVWVIPEAG